MERLLPTLIDEWRNKLSSKRVTRDLQFSGLENKIDVAIGMRRTGKTFFVFQTIQSVLEKKIDPNSILYVDFEDDRLMPLSAEKAGSLIDGFYSLFPENHNRHCYLFLDEIQNVENWPQLVRRLHDTKNVKIYLTGSSAKLLSKEIASSLRGRSLGTEVWPFSFNEYLRAIDAEHDTSLMSRRILDQLGKHLLKYLSAGGFPEVVTIDQLNRTRVLQDYVDVVVFRDVVERYKVTNISLAKYLVRTMLRSAGKPFSHHKLYNDLKSQGIKVSKNTLYEYLGYFEDAYLSFSVPLWSNSLRKVQSNPKKIYAIDPGLATAFNADFSHNLGQMFENMIYLDLRRRGYEVYYYLTANRREVDFFAKALSQKSRLFQVCYNIADPQTEKRERQALEEAENELGIKGKIITAESYHSMFDEE